MPKRKNNLRVCLITAALIFFSLECPLLVGSQITAVAREKFQDYTYYLYVFTRKNRKMTEHTLIFHPCSFTISFSQRRIEHRLAMLWNPQTASGCKHLKHPDECIIELCLNQHWWSRTGTTWPSSQTRST